MKPSVLPRLSLPLLLLGLAAPAQTIYRCGNSYSAQPCPDGQTIQAADPRSTEQRQAHEARVRHEKRTAERLEQERLREEAAAARAAQQADRAQRAAERQAARNTASQRPKTQQRAQDRLPAYNAPAQPRH
ncbi:MAG: hypothetical protein ACK4J1_09565 [Hylemonella sp.]